MEPIASTLYVFSDARGWHARACGRLAVEWRRLFGTDCLALPFTAEARPADVIAIMQKRNPGVPVYVGTSLRPSRAYLGGDRTVPTRPCGHVGVPEPDGWCPACAEADEEAIHTCDERCDAMSGHHTAWGPRR